MAEIQINNKNSSRTGARSKKRSTRVDLTPMVDLGFLLITFFMFTTSLSTPTVMKLAVPENGDNSQAPESKTLNLILAGNNRVEYYKGNDIQSMQTTDYSSEGLRSVIQTAKNNLPNRNDLIVLIKPGELSSYKNVVATLDEMTINDVKRYVLMDMTDAEKKSLK
ncbi:MAG: biopolymer transporter ExbD [Chitinophagaceae bacterium]|jgi:biopolymer transport protein ExbD|nr:biopolymer transporter ExbD [Chitinophagaceae bacterium]